MAPDHLRETRADGYTLLVNPLHPLWIDEIEAAGAEFCWSTMWTDRAATHFAPVAGLGHKRWEYIDFHAHQSTLDWNRMRGAGVGAYKLPGWIATTEPDEAIVIVDDDLEQVVYDWADQRPGPTLLVQPSPKTGLTREHVDRILEFAADLDLTPVSA